VRVIPQSIQPIFDSARAHHEQTVETASAKVRAAADHLRTITAEGANRIAAVLDLVKLGVLTDPAEVERLLRAPIDDEQD
jgi:hypothetical protein